MSTGKFFCLVTARSGFQVWDVEEADNIRDLVSTHDGPISFMQMLPKPIVSKRSDDKLLVVCADGSIGSNTEDCIIHFKVVECKDIVSKAALAQFRAYQSPISALCFDPSGTLLVSASVQGHNINVFKIMPGPPGVSSSTVADASHVHLYRLQRGMTNAIIQDISFSDDSNWIMVSSSRGTSHLFTINPSGGPVDIPSSDASSIDLKNNVSGVTTRAAVRWPPNSTSQMPHHHSLYSSGPPVTLSVVSRIRNGNNSWRGTVTAVGVEPVNFQLREFWGSAVRSAATTRNVVKCWSCATSWRSATTNPAILQGRERQQNMEQKEWKLWEKWCYTLADFLGSFQFK